MHCRWLLPLAAFTLTGSLFCGRASAQTTPASHGIVIYNPVNKHYYEAIGLTSGITWPEARDAAAKRTFKGAHGHLVTILNEQVHDFLWWNLRLKDFAGGLYQNK